MTIAPASLAMARAASRVSSPARAALLDVFSATRSTSPRRNARARYAPTRPPPTTSTRLGARAELVVSSRAAVLASASSSTARVIARDARRARDGRAATFARESSGRSRARMAVVVARLCGSRAGSRRLTTICYENARATARANASNSDGAESRRAWLPKSDRRSCSSRGTRFSARRSSPSGRRRFGRTSAATRTRRRRVRA